MIRDASWKLALLCSAPPGTAYLLDFTAPTFNHAP